MKKSILSLSAAVALGGLGFAGSAGAVIVFDGTASEANTIVQSTANTGHMLYVPYFTAQGDEATFLNIVNTDTKNGKAVKVRFRGASNSDDLLDFTLFLSPGDVWSGMISRNSSGNVQILTNDKSCTIPAQNSGDWPGEFKADRLPSYVTSEVAQALMGEGYVEVLNMADLVPNSAVFNATKHTNGVPKCDSLDTDYLLSTAKENETESSVETKGLTYPTGGLMGSWLILNQSNTTAFSGAATSMTATKWSAPNIVDVDTSGLVTGSTKANIIFFPQYEDGAGNVSAYTADPLLSGNKSILEPVWFDLPDMSTPLTVLYDNTHTIGVTSTDGTTTVQWTGDDAPTGQANLLSAAMGKVNVINEYVATAAGAAVPFATDWVVAQPTRRYQVAVNYGGSASAAAPVLNSKGAYYTGSFVTVKPTPYGPQGCVNLSFGSYDREEGGKSSAGSFSPGKTNPFCGEVFVAQFGASSVLNAKVTVTDLSSQLAGQAGWGRIGTNDASKPIPIVGFSAIKFSNVAAGVNYGQTLPHRWVGAVK